MKNKALIVTYYWPPSGGSGVQRFLKFCKYLPEFDIQPSVLTVSNPTYPTTDESLKKDIPAGISTYKSTSIEPFDLYSLISGKSKSEAASPTTALKSDKWSTRVSRWIRANLFIPDARVGWLFTARNKALRIVEKQNIDCVITTGPPHSTHFVGRYLQRKTGTRWIADLRDPWTQVHYNQMLPRTRATVQFDLYLEKKVLKHADEVVVVSPGMKTLQNTIYKREYRIIPNGFDPADFPSHSAKKNGTFTIRHVGRINEATIPDGLFEALGNLDSHLDYRLEFIGNVHQKVQDYIHHYQLDQKVQIKSYQPHDQAIQSMQSADLLLLIIPGIANNELILTGKLFDYIGAQTPIMYIGPRSGDAAEVINELEIGYIFEHNNIEEIQTFLEKVLKGDSQPTMKLPRSLEQHPYSRKNLTGKLAQLIK